MENAAGTPHPWLAQGGGCPGLAVGLVAALRGADGDAAHLRSSRPGQAGAIKEADGKTTLASCVATMANPAQIPGAGFD